MLSKIVSYQPVIKISFVIRKRNVLVTTIKCRWRLFPFCQNDFSHHHRLSFYISLRYQHSKDVIEIQTSKFSHHQPQIVADTLSRQHNYHPAINITHKKLIDIVHRVINHSPVFIDERGNTESSEGIYLPPGDWYSVELEINSNGKITDGINHCYTFGKVNDKTIFWYRDFPCPMLSNPYLNPNYNISNDQLPFLGGSGDDVTGTIRIHNFEWLKGVAMPPWLKGVPIDYFYGK